MALEDSKYSSIENKTKKWAAMKLVIVVKLLFSPNSTWQSKFNFVGPHDDNIRAKEATDANLFSDWKVSWIPCLISHSFGRLSISVAGRKGGRNGGAEVSHKT